jgi:DnaK suppressor protein
MRTLTIEQREALGAQIAKRADALRTEVAASLRQPGNSDSIHLANHLAEIDDDAVADLETALDIAALERDLVELRELETAARSLHGPDFGVCEDCQQEIPFRRLVANPAAIRCTPCQAGHERKHGAPRSASM